MIINPNPTTPGTFNGMWIANFRVTFPDPVFSNPIFPQSMGAAYANLLPYDGTHLLATGNKPVVIRDLQTERAQDAEFDAMLNSLEAECKRQAGKTAMIKSVQVMAPDPAKPVTAQIVFVDGTTHRIPDCFALSASDTIFGAMFTAAMEEIARLAGFVVE